MMLAALTVGEWAGVATASLAGIAGIVTAIARVVKEKAPVELAELAQEEREVTQKTRRQDRDDSLAKRLLLEANARNERLQAALASKEHELSMVERSNVGLALGAERVEEIEAEHRSCRQLVESQNAKITSLEVKLAVCEANHANADAKAQWLESRLDRLDGGHERNPTLVPPRPRNITPSDTPAVTKERP